MLVEDHLRDVKKPPITCKPESAAQMAAVVMSSNHIGAMPVLNERGHLVGIVSERDILQCLASHGEAISWMLVTDIMTKNVITCGAEATMSDAKKLMLEHHIRHIVVTKDKSVIGILSMRDAMKAQLEEAAMEAQVLRDNVIANRFH